MNATTLTAILRHALGIASGWLLAKGIELDPTAIETIAGSLGALIAVAWSIWQKRKAA